MDIGLKENEISLALGAVRSGKGVEIKTIPKCRRS